eukprot:SAG31_NODE_1424_length_8394_cov_3.211814_1_plen_235_part_00
MPRRRVRTSLLGLTLLLASAILGPRTTLAAAEEQFKVLVKAAVRIGPELDSDPLGSFAVGEQISCGGSQEDRVTLPPSSTTELGSSSGQLRLRCAGHSSSSRSSSSVNGNKLSGWVSMISRSGKQLLEPLLPQSCDDSATRAEGDGNRVHAPRIQPGTPETERSNLCGAPDSEHFSELPLIGLHILSIADQLEPRRQLCRTEGDHLRLLLHVDGMLAVRLPMLSCPSHHRSFFM